MKKSIKIIAVLLVLVLTCAIASGCASSKVPVVAICQYAEHASLDNCRNGFIEGLKESGLVEGADFKIEYQNAGADDALNQQIAQNFVVTNSKLICAIATPSAIACYAQAEDKNIPVVFTAITDVESAGLASGNVTGTSDKLPVSAQLELIKQIQPNAKTVGIIYTTSEPNSVSAIKEYEENASKYGVKIETVGVTSQAEVTQAVDTLISKGVDCFSNLTDNNVVSVLPSILEKTNDKKIPVYGSEIEQVKLGCIAAAGIDYLELGKITGKMAAKILKGEATASEIPYESIKGFNCYINKNAAKSLNIELSQQIVDSSEIVG